jgi:hypothetical protein
MSRVVVVDIYGSSRQFPDNKILQRKGVKLLEDYVEEQNLQSNETLIFHEIDEEATKENQKERDEHEEKLAEEAQISNDLKAEIVLDRLTKKVSKKAESKVDEATTKEK